MPPFWEVPPPHTPARCADDVEADVRILMTKHSKIQPRGFDTIAQRNILHGRIDRLLDEHALFVAVENMTAGL